MFAQFYLMIRAFIRHRILHIDDRSQLDIAISNGLKIGESCTIMGECIIDPGHCWLIEIGNRVTFAPRVHVLAHDASTKRPLGYTRLGGVKIGDDVFVGAGTIILPGVTVGNRVVIGAGSVVSRNIPDNSVAVGSPARVVDSYDAFVVKRKAELDTSPCYGEQYRIDNIAAEGRDEMIHAIEKRGVGFVV